MSIPITLDATERPAPDFLKGPAKQLLIDGAWVEPRSARTFETFDAATGEVLARIASAGPEDVDLAVAAARRAFEAPSWADITPYQRSRVLLQIADVIEAHTEGKPRRIEIWFYRVGETNYLSGVPGKRGWYANLRADPAFILHLKHGVRADLAAVDRPITDPAERHRILGDIVDDLNQSHNPARIAQPVRLEDWENGSPLVEIQVADY